MFIPALLLLYIIKLWFPREKSMEINVSNKRFKGGWGVWGRQGRHECAGSPCFRVRFHSTQNFYYHGNFVTSKMYIFVWTMNNCLWAMFRLSLINRRLTDKVKIKICKWKTSRCKWTRFSEFIYSLQIFTNSSLRFNALFSMQVLFMQL